MLDTSPVTPARLRRLESAVASLLQTQLDVVLLPSEALLPLEAAARGLGRTGVSALNIITSPFGAAFGRWLREAGATVVDIEAVPGQAVNPEAIARALGDRPQVSLVSFVHVEAVSGVRNDAAAIAALARRHGALVVLDAVASMGAHELRLDDWGIDIAVIGPQKALAGSAGISMAAVSDRAWQAMSDNPAAPRGSALSLLDRSDQWVDSDERAMRGMPSRFEIIALEAAVDRIATEGLPGVQNRHRAAAAASRSGARALGLRPFASDADAACVVTTLAAPEGADARSVVQQTRAFRPAAAVSAGFGVLACRVIRIDHTGRRARLTTVLDALEAIGVALGQMSHLHGSISGALQAAEEAWTAERARVLVERT